MAKLSPGYSLPKAPKYQELPAAKPRAARGAPELVELRVQLEVVTPILGGSHQTRAIDDVDVIRAPSVRGHLRFWWRALYAAQYANADALYQRESALWGRAATDDGGRSVVEIRVSVERAGGTDNTEIRLYPGQGQQATPGAYALWPARGETRTTTPTAPRRQPGTQFQLTLKVAGSATDEGEVRNALRAWILFGGYGGRTRRGLGSLKVIGNVNGWLPTAATREALTGLFGVDVFTAPTRTPGDVPWFGGAAIHVGRADRNAQTAWTTALDWLKGFPRARPTTSNLGAPANPERVGHGNESAIDVGLTVHHTWGVPIIPGSALKGLVAHYVDATYGPAEPHKKPWEQHGDERVRADYQGVTWNRRRIECGPGVVYRALFGAPDAREDATMRENGFEAGAAAGLVTFHDALYVPGSSTDDRPFAADVLTVHQKGYYGSSGQSEPNDYDSPKPVAFLTVRPKCRLLLAVSGPSEWSELAAQLLADALKNWGVGGKTAAGYGIGTVGAWKVPAPRRSKAEQAVADLEKHSKDALSGDIEKWLRGEAVTGPMRALLSAAPDAPTKEHLDIVQAIGVKFDLRAAWANRLTNKKADEQKKARARGLIEAWDRLFPAGGRT